MEKNTRKFCATVEWFPRYPGEVRFEKRPRRQLLPDTENDVKNRSKEIVPAVGI